MGIIFYIQNVVLCLYLFSKFSLNISCSVKTFLHFRYPVDGGSIMHVLEDQRSRTNLCVQHAEAKELLRKFMYQ